MPFRITLLSATGESKTFDGFSSSEKCEVFASQFSDIHDMKIVFYKGGRRRNINLRMSPEKLQKRQQQMRRMY